MLERWESSKVWACQQVNTSAVAALRVVLVYALQRKVPDIHKARW